MDHSFYNLRITKIKQETADTKTFTFENHPSFSDYKPGQFITVQAEIDHKKIRRAYSLSSTAKIDAQPSITIKALANGLMSNWVQSLHEGDQLSCMPPMGNFVFQPVQNKKRWFMLYAAGSGITPIFSILKAILAEEPQSYVSLLYGSRYENQIIFKEELDLLQLKYPARFKLLHTISQPSPSWIGERGRIDEELIMSTLEFLKPVSPFEDTLVYMCGPQAMMDDLIPVLMQQGVKKENIHRESFFTSLDDLAKQAEKEAQNLSERKVKLHLDGETFEFEVDPASTILEAALREGIDMPYSCQSGLCTACRGKCLSGQVYMEENDGLSDDEIQEGYVLTCVGHPLTDEVEIEMD